MTTGGAAALTEAAVRIDLPVARFDPSSPSHPPRAAEQNSRSCTGRRPIAPRRLRHCSPDSTTLHVVVANPDVALRELDLLTDAEHATMAALSGPPPVAPRFLDDVLATPATGWPDTTGPAGGRGGTTTRSPIQCPLARVLRARGAGPKRLWRCVSAARRNRWPPCGRWPRPEPLSCPSTPPIRPTGSRS